MHGGTSIPAVIAANTKHGRYAKCIPPKLADAYAEQANDPQLLDLVADVALARTLFQSFLASAHKSADVDARALDTLTELIDRIGRLVERHEKIQHQAKNVVTHEKLVLYLAQVANIVMEAINRNVRDTQDRGRAIADVRSGMASFCDTDISG